MDEAKVLELIKGYFDSNMEGLLKPVVEALTGDVTKFLKDSLDPLETRLVQLEDVTTSPKDSKEAPKEDPKDPLALRLKELEEKLAERDRVAQQTAFELSLGEAIAATGTKYPNEAKQYLKGLYEGAKSTDGAWITKDGKKLTEAVTEFFGTEFGKHLLPSDYKDGQGTKPPEKQHTGGKEPTASEMILGAFL